jgi:ATP-dependent protease ClpP protease subunit
MKTKIKSIQNTENDSEEETDDDVIIKVDQNRVYFHADVTRENCFKLIESLQKAQEYIAIQYIKNEFEEMGKIYLYLFSDGGELYAGFNIADFIQKSKVDIITVVEGCVASAGSIISMAGKERYIRKNAYMLIHELRSGCLGKYSECQDDMENNNILMDHMKKFVNERCQNTKLEKKLDKVLKHDHIWDPEKCIKYGLVDKIV